MAQDKTGWPIRSATTFWLLWMWDLAVSLSAQFCLGWSNVSRIGIAMADIVENQCQQKLFADPTGDPVPLCRFGVSKAMRWRIPQQCAKIGRTSLNSMPTDRLWELPLFQQLWSSRSSTGPGSASKHSQRGRYFIKDWTEGLGSKGSVQLYYTYDR